MWLICLRFGTFPSIQILHKRHISLSISRFLFMKGRGEVNIGRGGSCFLDSQNLLHF